MSDDEIPSVVSAAIMGEDGKPYTLPPPARHSDVIRHMARLGHKIPISGEQGFMLSDGTFARRRAAKVHAVMNDQLLPTAGKLDALYSEDVW